MFDRYYESYVLILYGNLVYLLLLKFYSVNKKKSYIVVYIQPKFIPQTNLSTNRIYKSQFYGAEHGGNTLIDLIVE